MADNYIFTDDYGNFESYVVNNDGSFNLLPQIGVANTVINENTVINTNSIAMTNSTVNFILNRPTATQFNGLYLLTGNGYWTRAADIIASTSANTDGRFVWTNNHTFTNTITFNSVIVGTANNANNLGGVAASGYQTTAGLSANVATLTANNASYLGTVAAASYQGTANLAAAVALLPANNASYLGGTAAASYQLNSTLSANVATLTANNANNLGGTAAASYQLNSTLAANVAILTANNSNNLNGQPPTYYTNATNMASGTLPYARLGVNVVNTTSNFNIYGIPTYNSNLVFTSTAAVIANGTTGTIGQVLMTNGTSVYWDGVASAAVNVNTAYTFSNVINFGNTVNFNRSVAFSNTINFGPSGLLVSNGTFTASVTVNGNFSVGTTSAPRKATFANGECVFAPYTAAEGASTNTYFMNLCDISGNNGNNMSLHIRGLYSSGSSEGSLVSVNMTTNVLNVTGDVVSAYSDDRLKNRIGNITNALEKVISLNGFYYTPNKTAINIGVENNQLSKIGVSAQEVQAVLSEAVKPAPIGQGYLTVQYEKLIPLLIEAIKEQQEQINRLNDLINRGQ